MITSLKRKIVNLALAGVVALGCVGVATTTALVSTANDATTAYAQGWRHGKGGWCYQMGEQCATGWKQINRTWYCFDNNGCMKTGWNKMGNCWYYHNSSGAMMTGWQKVNGCWYHFNNSGAMCTGWNKVNGCWYYHNPSGAMVTGWSKVGSTWYYHNNSGAMATGWQYINGAWYYFDGSGAMANNQWVGNYYLKGNGAMVINQWVGNYYVGGDGAWIPGYGQSSNDNNSSSNQIGEEVYWTAHGKRWHTRSDCSGLNNANAVYSGPLSQAQAMGLTRCQKC